MINKIKSTMKYKHIVICEKCGKEFEIECTDFSWEHKKYKKYCSRSCANKHIYSEEIKKKISDGVKKYNKIKETSVYEYICEKCGNTFTSNKILRKDRKKHCDNCKRNTVHYKENPISIFDLSKRTISKILKRANKGCQICNWNESTCDIHHIIPKKEGGTDDISNLIIVCPNCHRVLHTIKNRYFIDFLLSKNIFNTFNNWKDFYHMKN